MVKKLLKYLHKRFVRVNVRSKLRQILTLKLFLIIICCFNTAQKMITCEGWWTEQYCVMYYWHWYWWWFV